MIRPANDARFAAWIRRNYGARARSLGWLSAKGESPDVLRLREAALPLVAERGQDAALARAAPRLPPHRVTPRNGGVRRGRAGRSAARTAAPPTAGRPPGPPAISFS